MSAPSPTNFTYNGTRGLPASLKRVPAPPSGSDSPQPDFKVPSTPASSSNGQSYQNAMQWTASYGGGQYASGSTTNAGASTSTNTTAGAGATASTPGGMTYLNSASGQTGNALNTAAIQNRINQLTMPGDYTPRRTPAGAGGHEDEGEDDENLPAMADDDYSAQLSWQSQSKDNLKVLMDNFTDAQYERFEAYRRHALPKQAVRKVIQQATGQQVSQPVAQIVAGFSKVFVGEMVEKARAVQARRGDTGPLTPDHLREAYRLYQQDTGRVGAARPVRSKRLFMR